MTSLAWEARLDASYEEALERVDLFAHLRLLRAVPDGLQRRMIQWTASVARVPGDFSD